MFKNSSVKLAAFTVIILSALGIAACAPSVQPPEPSAGTPGGQAAGGNTWSTKLEAAKQLGGKFTVTETSAFGNPNDPHLVVTATGRMYSVPVTNWLLKRDVFDENLPVVGDLAKSWEASKDGLSYSFKLREGVKFHNVPPVNGRELTSEDVKYSLRRITADPSVIVEKWKPRFQRRLEFGEIESIETPDKYTVVVKLKRPHTPFVDAIAHPGTQVLPREFVEKFPEKIITEGMVGTGPFIPVEYRNQQVATYKKNPDYWKKDPLGSQLPYLDEVHLLYFGDPQTQIAAFRARHLDMTGGLDKTNVDAIKRDVPDAHVLLSPSLSISTYRFSMKFKPFQDVRVRRAIHLALDRHQILELLGQGVGVVSGPVTPKYKDVANTMDWLLSQPGYRKDKTQDMAEAKRLMKEAGYEDGFTVSAMFSSSSTAGDWASLLTDQLKPLRISIKAEIVDYAGEWVPRSSRGEFELSWMSHKMASDADSVLGTHLHSQGGRNYGKFADPVLDGLIEKQQTATTPEDRRRWAQEAEKRVLDQVPVVFLYDPFSTMLARPWVHNVGSLLGEGPLQYVDMTWLEKR